MSRIFYWYVIRVSYIIVISNEPHILLIYYKSELYSVISNEPRILLIYYRVRHTRKQQKAKTEPPESQVSGTCLIIT